MNKKKIEFSDLNGWLKTAVAFSLFGIAWLVLIFCIGFIAGIAAGI